MSLLFQSTYLLCPVVLQMNMLDDLKKNVLLDVFFVGWAEQRLPP
jgi:hypothetical protein